MLKRIAFKKIEMNMNVTMRFRVIMAGILRLGPRSNKSVISLTPVPFEPYLAMLISGAY